MSEKSLSGMSPTRLRVVLLMTIVAMLVVTAIGFWLFKGWLSDYALSVDKDARQATSSSNDIIALQQLQTQLEENSVAVNRTKNIVADSKSYLYQVQIINDLNTYAKSSGISLSGFSFQDSSTTGGATPAGSAAPTANTTPTTPTAPAGLKTTSVTISINNPVNYKSIMRFIHAIEANLTKMQLTGISMTKSDQAGSDAVTINPLTVEVYIR